MATIEKFIVETSNSFSSIIDFDTYEIRWMNRATSEMFPETEAGHTCYRAYFNLTSPCPDCPLAEVKQHRRSVSRQVFFEKTRRWVKMHYQYAVIDERPCSVCVGTDVTALKSSLIMAENVLDSLKAIAYIIDRNSYELRFANRTLKNYLPGLIPGKKCYEVLWDRTQPCDVCPMAELKPDHSHNIEMYNPKFRRLLSLDGVLLKTLQNEDLAVFTGHDVTHRLEYESKLKKLAYFDSMLDIGNPAGFHKNVERVIQQGKNAHLCLASIRNFNNVNMLFGRERGDGILKSFAAGFSGHVPDGKVYRVGGCKFAFVTDSPETGLSVLKDVWKDVFVSLPQEMKNFYIPIDTVFIEFPRFADTPEMLLIHAEYKLKTNTGSEHGKRMVFDDDDRQMMERRSLLTSVIRTALDNETFRVFYQPIYSFGDRSYTKSEALLRLYDEHLGWITPDEFIPIAEEQGLIHDLGLYVLEQVCKKLVDRQEKGLPPVGIHINVSTVQFSRNGFFAAFMDIIERYGVDPSLIVMEVTESIMIQSFDFIMSIMKQFIDRGVCFSLDDFGTGYSSLNYIAALPISSIKLDKSFIDRSEKSAVYALLIKNVVEIARGLQLELIVEGVETHGQVEALTKMGCQAMQGYYFSKPLPETELDDFFTRDVSLPAACETSAIS